MNDEVRAANDAYYAALSARDLDAMGQLWSQTAEVVNIAPPVRPAAHVGWDAVKKNYVNFWGTLDQLTVSMEEPTIVIKDQVAWAYGMETTKHRTKTGDSGGGQHFGTSIFVNEGGRWLMVFHRAA
jgi:ketosteroid isomerase-like protein